ncbi:MAG: c-type cytochrome [Myxococcales bacterium]|nr:c-type cytochrome [Myxococcales bacterium]
MRRATLLFLVLVIGVSCDKSKPGGTGAAPSAPALSAEPSAAAATGRLVFEANCISCHTVGEGDRTGPDLKDVGKRRTHDWLVRWIKNPAQMGESDHIGRAISKKYGDVIMPTIALTDAQIDQLLAFVDDASVRGYKIPARPAKQLSSAELEKAQGIYFDRCAGCHGSLRQGASAPAIGAERAKQIGAAGLVATLNHGRPGGMPAWGELGILSTADVELLSSYLQLPPIARPELPLDVAKKSWNLTTPVAERPKKPAHTRKYQNFFAVVLKYQGYVAILDGDTRERLVQVDVGFAVELVRASASGRYLYAMGRDGRITLIDLYTNPPAIAAQSRGCFDARSLEVSRAASDKFLIQGCYWPPQYVVYDGTTLEPRHVEPLAPAADGGIAVAEARVGSIVSPRGKPFWALGLMDSGEVALVEYGKPGFGVSARFAAEREVMAGGLDPSGRYFLLPAPTKNQVLIVDLEEKKEIARVATGKNPRPDPGARWEDPEFGWVAAVPQLGAENLLVFGIDPKKPEHLWKEVRKIEGVPSGALFVRTHPKSPWVWLDSPANSKPELARQICVISKKEGKVHKCWAPRSSGRATHFEYNQAGTEVWVSGWDKKGALIIYEDASLAEVQRIEADWVVNPMNKINVYNSANDVY